MLKIAISEVVFLPIRPTDKGLVGFASCCFDNRLALSSIAIYSTPTGGIRLLFPEKTLVNGKKLNVFYPINRETYELIRQAIEDKIEELNKKVIEENEEANCQL